MGAETAWWLGADVTPLVTVLFEIFEVDKLATERLFYATDHRPVDVSPFLAFLN